MSIIPEDPFQLFDEWLTVALQSQFREPRAMALATVGATGKPSVRIVLLKACEKSGIIFYTNYESRKGNELDVNPYASATIWWDKLERQVRFEGSISKVEAQTSDEYFASRPRGSQLSAAASAQSRVMNSPSELIEEIEKLETRYQDKSIPRPDFWGGYFLKPERIEFWQGRQSRRHDRWLYTCGDDGSWTTCALNP